MIQQISLLPDSAPFTEEQRTWLNGFLAGWIGLQGNDGAGAAATVAASLMDEPSSKAPANDADNDEEFPWHDPVVSLDERLQLSEGKPLKHRLMSAMAQLDCGSCGYDCKRYGEALAAGEEKNLKLCSPGGKDTAKKLKELFQLDSNHSANGAAVHGIGHVNGKSKGTNGAAVAGVLSPKAPEAQWTRTKPLTARIKNTRNLNGAGSAKQTTHVEIDLLGSGLTYEVGDSLGVTPTNCQKLVQEILDELQATGNELIAINDQQVPFQRALTDDFCLTEITDDLISRMSDRCHDAGDANRLRQLLENSDAIDGWDVLELLRSFPSARPSVEDLAGTLSRLKPRLYSISSSLKAHPDQVHLTVGRVGWDFRGRQRLGVASTMFADRLCVGDSVKVFVQKSHGFTVPQNPQAPAIMIGPGTGIAPFRAFLQERSAVSAPGSNWLFFGDQRSETDFLYRDELEQLQTAGQLTRLEVAFSRDQEEKIYVQDRMVEHGAEFWRWLEEGAHVYVCGDGKRMAVDVDKALRKVVVEFGRKSADEANEYVGRMLKEHRYCRDVY